MKNRVAALAAALVFCLGCLAASPAAVQASVWDNAYEYYTKYGDSVAFRTSDVSIYYCTRGNVSSAGTRYTTLGWKFTIKNAGGSTIETLYFQLNGDYMKNISTVTEGGYEYDLYRLSLENMMDAMSAYARGVLESGGCTIVIDACMTVVRDGTPDGSMTGDNGNFSDKVYTTYDGIVNAAGWSEAAEAALESYFGKTLSSMFYSVTPIAGEGISSVSGKGQYMYGTTATVSAVEEEDYCFQKWSGTYSSTLPTYSFTVKGNATLTASALPIDETAVRNTADLDPVETRFISSEYLGKSVSEGGLPSSSRWLCDSTLYALLKSALDKCS